MRKDHSEKNKKYLVVTAHHDYRTPRRASIHFIADELKNRGSLRFFSLRYSNLSKRKGDIRSPLDNKSNKIETYNGAECYLWKSFIHPFNFQNKFFNFLENLFFWIYKNTKNEVLDNWAKEADVIIYESGIAPIFFDRLKKINPNAKHIYRASDDLATINVAEFAKRDFLRASPNMDAVCLVSRSMADNIPYKSNLYCVPHGINDNINSAGDPSPYVAGLHAVSVGSMLFDSSFIAAASTIFPDITFHVIGSGKPRLDTYASNVIVYDHMPYMETIRYIKHACIGIAPYIATDVPVYLADSSLKMLQYDYFALPTVCPYNVTGNYDSRFGYTPGDSKSIKKAIDSAMAAPHKKSREIRNWADTTDRLLDPKLYEDTKI